MLPAALAESNIKPIKNGKAIPPMEPAMPPIPTTELTARLGNISDAVVKMLALQAWCAAAAKLMSATACQMLAAYRAANMGNTQRAKINIAVLRALNTGIPLLINLDDK